MKRVLFDVNVALDALQARAPHARPAEALWAAAERRDIAGLVPAHGVTTIFYLLSRARRAVYAREAVTSLLSVFEVAPVDRAVLTRALAIECPDFEDAVCAAAGEAASCDFLVTRDPSGFLGSPIPVIDPTTACSLLLGPAGPDRVSEPPPARSRARARPRPRSSLAALRRAGSGRPPR